MPEIKKPIDPPDEKPDLDAEPDEPNDDDLCSECDGSGWVYDPNDGETMTCPVCDGTGRV